MLRDCPQLPEKVSVVRELSRCWNLLKEVFGDAVCGSAIVCVLTGVICSPCSALGGLGTSWAGIFSPCWQGWCPCTQPCPGCARVVFVFAASVLIGTSISEGQNAASEQLVLHTDLAWSVWGLQPVSCSSSCAGDGPKQRAWSLCAPQELHPCAGALHRNCAENKRSSRAPLLFVSSLWSFRDQPGLGSPRENPGLALLVLPLHRLLNFLISGCIPHELG